MIKILHSFWSKPSLKIQNLHADDRASGGWSDKKYHLMSWALSCLRVKEYYDRIELVTDEKGKDLLIDKLQLPYTKVLIKLNALDKYNPDLWTLSKIYACSIQKEPFIHIDNDVYIWKKFSTDIELAPLVAQNIELNHTFYQDLLNQIENIFTIPDVIVEERKRTPDIFAANTGIVGGN